MEKIIAFAVEDGRLVKKEWLVSDNKEGEYDKPTIKDDFSIFKEKCMQDEECKAEYERLQPEYDKIKENIEKNLELEKGKTQTVEDMREDFNKRACITYLNVHKLYEDGFISKKLMERILPEGDFNSYFFETLLQKYKIINNCESKSVDEEKDVKERAEIILNKILGENI